MKERYTEAQLHYREGLKTNPRSTKLMNNMGYSKYPEGDLEGALGHYQEVLNIDRNNRKAWSNLGLLYVRQEKYESAINAFSQLMDKPEAYNSIGYLCLIDRKYAEAKEFFSRAIKYAPSYYDEAHRNLANTKIRIADTEVSGKRELHWSIFGE